MIGTRAPSTMPAAVGLGQEVRILRKHVAGFEIRNDQNLRVPRDRSTDALDRAASGSMALSKASGPSRTPPVIWPGRPSCRAPPLRSSTGSSVVRFRLPEGSQPAAHLIRRHQRSIAFWTMSRLASRSGKMLIAASVMKSVSAWPGTSMMKT